MGRRFAESRSSVYLVADSPAVFGLMCFLMMREERTAHPDIFACRPVLTASGDNAVGQRHMYLFSSLVVPWLDDVSLLAFDSSIRTQLLI